MSIPEMTLSSDRCRSVSARRPARRVFARLQRRL